MNLSTIKEMILADPTIPSNVPAFLTRMNAKTQRRVDRVMTVTDVVTMVSIAEMNGGPATAADVQAASILANSGPSQVRAESVMAAVQAAINDGTVTDLATLRTAFSAAAAAVR